MTRRSRSTACGVGVVLAVGAALTLGLQYAGAPAAERSRRIDQRRVDDLRQIGDRVDLYWTRQGELPPSLDALAEDGSDLTGFADPVTADQYEYRILTTSSFELCAQFDTATSSPDGREFWRHQAGRQCFEADAEDVERHRRRGLHRRPLREGAADPRIRSTQPPVFR